MAYANVREIRKDIDDLISDGFKLIDSLTDDYEADQNDWCKTHRVNERMFLLDYQIIVVSDFICLIYANLENEKDKFEVQKTAQYHYKELEGFLDIYLVINYCS